MGYFTLILPQQFGNCDLTNVFNGSIHRYTYYIIVNCLEFNTRTRVSQAYKIDYFDLYYIENNIHAYA